MGLLITIVAGLVIWIVMWALGHSGLDAGFIALAVTIVGSSVWILAGYLPGRRRS